MPDAFRGMNAVVTGSSYGIGAATAERLAAEGANVALVGRTATAADRKPRGPGSLEETAARLERYGAKVVRIRADMADERERADVIPRAVEGLGGAVDILVNNAAAGMYHSVLDYSVERRRAMFEINFNAPVDLSQAVAPGMREKGRGWIVNVSSGTARYAAVSGPPFATGFAAALGVYGATKAALNRITVTFAAELHGAGVRVNTVEPNGAVASEGAMARGMDMIPDDAFQSMEAMVESIVALCQCDTDHTGRIERSLDLLEEMRRPVMTLDGTAVYAGGYRRLT